MRIKKQLKKSLIILPLILAAFMVSSYANERIIADVEVLSEKSAKIELKGLDNESKYPIKILGWTLVNDDTLKIIYETGPSISKGWNIRRIEGENLKFPIKIFLEEKGKENVTFPDLPKNEEIKQSILNLFYQGIISGYTDGSFKPKNNVSRAEFAKMISITAKYNITNQGKAARFNDIKDTFWARNYIYYLAEKEIIKGRGDGTFDPNGNISIGEVLAVINRTFIIFNKENSYKGSLANHWSNNDFLTMVEAGIVKPSDDFYISYKPNNKATREECALLLSRVLEQFNESQ